MDITVIANHPIVTTIVLNAGVFLDDKPDTLYLSNPLPKPVPVAFFKPEPIELTFEGHPLESLELAPNTLAKLAVTGGDISIEKVSEGSVYPVALVDPGVLDPTNWWNFKTDLKKGQKGFGHKQMKALYEEELAKIQAQLI